MTVMIKDIGWGTYLDREGPRYIGNKHFVMPQNPTFDQKVMSVISASEGLASSINMYDRAILSCGFIQWIELGQYSVSNMIGYVAETCGIELVEQHLHPALLMSKATFKKTDQGLWRFHIPDPNGNEVVVNTETLSRYMFTRSSSKIGTWSETNKLWAKCWAASIADLFEDDAAVAAQVAWTVPQLKANFVLRQGKAIVFEEGSSYDGYAGVIKALLIAYGVNLPAVAERVIATAAARSTFPKWTKQWCLDLAHDLALTSGISLWPGRYNYKRPALEAAFGVELPKNASELALRAWANEPLGTGSPWVPSPVVNVPSVETNIEVPAPNAAVDVFVRPDSPVSTPVSPSFWGALSGISNSILDKLGRR